MIYLVVFLVLLMNSGCAVLTYGLVLGDFTRQFSYQKNVDVAVQFAILAVVFGPITLGLMAILCDWSAFRLHPIPTEERFQIFNRNYSSLGREYFDKNIG